MIPHTTLLFSFSALILTLATAEVITGINSCIPAGGFELCQEIYQSASDKTSQISTPIRSTSSSVAWSTQYQYDTVNVTDVKSIVNVDSRAARGHQLNKLPLLAFAWSWEYLSSTPNLRATIGFDIWIGKTLNGKPHSSDSSFEIKILLAASGGVKPVGSKIHSATSISGFDWDVWRGEDENWQVTTFVNVDNANIPEFTGNLVDFFAYLLKEQGIPKSYFVQRVRAGTETFSGGAELMTSLYTLWVEYPE